MAEEHQVQEVENGPRKRKLGHKKGKGKKKTKVFHGGSGQKVKMDGKMKKLFRKKARDYNSDDSDDVNEIEEEEPSPAPQTKPEKKQFHDKKQLNEKKQFHEKKQVHEKKQLDNEDEVDDEMSSDEDADEDDDADVDANADVDVDADMGDDVSDDEGGEIEHGVMKFSEGSNSFKKAFKKIVKRSGTDDVLGPVLSAYKKLVVKKLAEEAVEKKVKGDAKKEKTTLGEKGHVKPDALTDAFPVTHEKLLMGVATKGVVKLFNAVNKAQSSQRGLNPSRSKDAKVIQKRRKEAFFSELGKPLSSSDAKVSTGDGEGPAWAPLRDNYMLTTSKLKDWDKTADAPEAADDFGRQEDSSSDDDD